MKTSKKLWLLSFAALAMAACSNDETADLLPDLQPVTGETVDVTVDLSVAAMNASDMGTAPAGVAAAGSGDILEVVSTPVTRATEAAETNEAKINDLWVVQFIGETLKYAHQFTASELTGGLSCPLSTEANSTVYFIANTGNTLSVAEGTTKTTFAAKTYPITKIAYATNGASLPMVYTHTAQITATSFTATLTPIVAKVRLALIDGTSGQFKPKTVQICNVPTNVNLFNATTVAGSTNVTASYAADTRTTFSTTAAPITLYVPENMQTATVSGTRDGSNAQYATCIKVAGTYGDFDVTYSIYPGGTSDYKIQRNNIYGITATIKGMNPNDTRVSAICDLSATETANCYMVSEGQIYYRFRANVMGNGATTTKTTSGNGANITPTALEPKSAKILWQQSSDNNTTTTVISDVSIETINNVPYVKFKTAGSYGSPVKEGNALIAVYTSTDGTGTPIWSWHIWSTAYKGGTVAHVTRMTAADYTTVDMMTRNLGAMAETGWQSYGLLYQWGRKDPFINSGATANTATAVVGTATTTVAIATSGTGANAIAYTIKNPTVFITNSADPYDWYSTTASTVTNFRASQHDFLWGNGDKSSNQTFVQDRPANNKKGSKSIYDPCPPGYRVPPQGTWTNFTSNGGDTDQGTAGSTKPTSNISGTFSSGYTFYVAATGSGATSFYPAAGYRNCSSGALTGVGSGGYYWSSSPYSETSYGAGYLRFHSGRVIPVGNNNRANGFSVRCAKNL